MFVGRADPRGRRASTRRPRRTPSRRSRSTTRRCRSPSIRSRACSRAAGRAQRRQRRSARWPDRCKIKWTAADFARVRRRADADGQARRGVDVRRRRGGVQEAQGGVRRGVRDGGWRTTAWSRARAWPTGRTASASCTPRRRARAFVCRGWRGCSASSPKNSCSSPNICGGGFGSKGGAYPIMAVPALHVEEDRQAGDDAHQPRRGVLPRFRAHRLPGPHQDRLRRRRPRYGRRRLRRAGERRDTRASATGRPRRTRWRWSISPPPCAGAASPVITNTPPRTAQRGPGQNQIACAMEPLIDRAARELGSTASRSAATTPPMNGARSARTQGPVTSAYLREALDKGAAKFNWDERKKRSGQKQRHQGDGHRRRQGVPPGGFAGFDGLVCSSPTASCTSTPASAISARSRTRARRASPPKCSRRLGELRHRARRQPQEPALEHRPVRQQHLVHDDADELRRARRTPRQAQGDRGEGPGRRAGRLRHRRQEGVREADPCKSADLRGGGPARDRAGRQVRRPRDCPRTSIR